MKNIANRQKRIVKAHQNIQKRLLELQKIKRQQRETARKKKPHS